MAYAILPSRALITLEGDDVVDFLQGIISNDARRLSSGEALYAALLTPQGKFLHDFFLVPWNGRIWLDVDKSRTSDLLARLKMYKLRSKVNIAMGEGYVAAMWGEKTALTEGAYSYVDPRLPALGSRVITSGSPPQVGEDAYETHRLSLGVPDSRDMIVDKSLLLECGFEELHGVDFNKGCYVGQEVTARSKFRGQVRKQFYVVDAQPALPPIGTGICAGEKIIGNMRTSAGNRGLAIVHRDDYEAALAAGAKIYAGDIAISLSAPTWIKNTI